MISDIGPLSALTNLYFLDIRDNLVTDVTPIAGLTKLESLFVSKNLIKDYSPLSDVASDMSDRDFEPVAAPQAIGFNDAVLEQRVCERLGIPEGDITIADTEAVTELLLGNAWQETIPDDIKIRNIGALKYFPNLSKAELWFNGIDRVEALRALPNLGILDLNGNPVYDITPIASCTNLKTLNTGGTSTNNISALAGLTQLESLNLSYMPNLGNIEPVSNLTNLKELRLESLNVSLEPISNLTNLTTLYINQSTDKDLSPLAGIYPNLVDKNFELPQG